MRSWRNICGCLGMASVVLLAGPVWAVAPVAYDQEEVIAVGSVHYGIYLLSDDPDSYPLSYRMITGPSQGALEWGNGQDYWPVLTNVPIDTGYWYFTPSGTNTGSETITWEVSDETATSGIATVSIMVTTNSPPVALAQDIDMGVGSIRYPIDLSYNHGDHYQSMTYRCASLPGKGVLEYRIATNYYPITTSTTCPSTRIYYTPSGTMGETDSFDWQVSDGLATADVETISITMTNSSPTAYEGEESMPVGSVHYPIGLYYDHADYYQPVTFVLVNAPSRGTMEWLDGSNYVALLPNTPVSSITSGGYCTYWYYTPSGTNTGTDNLTWQVSDGMTTSETANVSIILTANSAPVAVNQSRTLLADSSRIRLFLNVTHDLDYYQNLTFYMTAVPAHGTLEYRPDANSYAAIPVNTPIETSDWYFTPSNGYAGADHFHWKVTDGIATSAQATYSLTIVSNQPPFVSAIRASMLPNTNLTLSAIFYDRDPDQSSWTASLGDEPSHGTVEMTGALGFRYTPAPDFLGVDRFTYTVSDGLVDSVAAPVFIQVREENDRAGNLVILAVTSNLWLNLSNEVERLKTDLIDEGYTSQVVTLSETINASNLWRSLKTAYENTNQWLTGAILIGNLPKANSPYNDLAYWNMKEFQTSGDISDYHIWVSRLYATGSGYGNEVDLIRRALVANHECRKGISRLPRKAYFYHCMTSYASMGPNLLEVWPSVAITNENSVDGYASSVEFLPSRTDITEAGADAFVAGGDVFQETSHGNAGAYMNGKFTTADLFKLIAQQRSCMLESCTVGAIDGIANQHVFTRGGGCIFAVSGSHLNGVGDFQIAKDYDAVWAPAYGLFRQSLAAGESWGGALLKNYIFRARNRTMFYGDLSLSVMISEPNELPVITSLTASSTKALTGQPVKFAIVVSDPDAALSDSPHVDFEHQVEWFTAGYNAGRNAPTYTTNSNDSAWTNQTHVFSTAGTYVLRAEVMDEWKARGWKEVTITVNMATVTVNSAYGGVNPGTLVTNWGAELSLWVTNSPALEGAGTQHVCVGATVSGNTAAQPSPTNVTLTVTNQVKVTWQWGTNYWLAVSNGPHGAVTVTNGWRTVGVTTTVTAQADLYFYFTNWTGDVTAGQAVSNPLALLMNGAKSVTACFAETLAASNTPHWWLAEHGLATDETGETHEEGDGIPAWKEFVADTDPTNPASYFHVAAFSNLPPWMVYFDSSSNREYTLESLTDLVTGTWEPVHPSNVPGVGGSFSLSDTNPPTSVRFFRVRVHVPPE